MGCRHVGRGNECGSLLLCLSPNCLQLMSKNETRGGVLYASRREAPENFDAFRFVMQPHLSSAVIVSRAKKLASKLSPQCQFGVECVVLSRGRGFRGRPPFLPASDAISRRRSGESFSARALPPSRANSETVSGFFMPTAYHALGMQAAARSRCHVLRCLQRCISGEQQREASAAEAISQY